LGQPNGSGRVALTEARLSTGPALDDARAGGGPDEGQISIKPSRIYGVQQPTQVRSRACGAAGDLKQSKTKQSKTVQ
jgi:hypothetical protein